MSWYENQDGKITVRGPMAIPFMLAVAPLVLAVMLFAVVLFVVACPIALIGAAGNKLGKRSATPPHHTGE